MLFEVFGLFSCVILANACHYTITSLQLFYNILFDIKEHVVVLPCIARVLGPGLS